MKKYGMSQMERLAAAMKSSLRPRVVRVENGAVRRPIARLVAVCVIVVCGAGMTQGATFTVNSAFDTHDANPGDGVAQDSNGDTTFRAAVEEANALSGADTIQFANGLNNQTIYLDIGPVTITDTLTVSGPGSTLLTLSRNGMSGVDDLLLVVQTSVTASFSGLSISNNSTASYDGAALASHGTTTISNCLFSGNSNVQNGGSIAVDSGALSISGSTFYQGGGGAFGGAIYSSGGATTITECTFNGQGISNDGACIYNYGGNVTVERSLFCNAFATGNGGAIANEGNSPVTSTLLVVNCTFSNNGATLYGGAIANIGTGAATTIKHSTVAYNYVYGGGGMGGGIYNSYGGVTIENTIIARNYINGCCGTDPDVRGSYSSSGGNIIGDVGSATGFGSTGDQLNTDPLINSALANNGGPTLTHSLQAMSPAIDAGLNAGAPSTDQRGSGFTRIVNGTVDIGAYEVQ